MKEKIKKILLWIVFVWLIVGFIQILINIITITSPSYYSSLKTKLEAEGVEVVVYPEFDVFLNIVFLILWGGFIYWVYKKLFLKKKAKEEAKDLQKEIDKGFGGSFLNKALFISHFFVLIFAISQFIIGRWKLGIFSVVIAILMAYIAYCLAGGRENPAIWE